MAPPGNSMRQEFALDLIEQQRKRGAGIWPSIDVDDLALSLKQRVEDPTKINQGKLAACAPAAVAYDLVRNDPSEYAKTVFELYRMGVTLLPGQQGSSAQLVASESLRKEDYNTFYGPRARTSDQPAADWILLSSIRNTESWFNIYWGTSFVLGWPSGATHPSTFKKWLEDFGYKHIIEQANVLLCKGRMDLVDASSYYSNGWRVFLFVNAKCLSEETQSDRSLSADHYITLTSKVAFAQRSVTFRCQTWGKERSLEQDSRFPLTEEQFYRNFYGYFAAKS